MKVLIVDDEEVIRDIIKEYIEFEQMIPVEAADGYEALDCLKKDKEIDVVVLDIMMPRLNGYETLKEIRRTSNIPVIMLSAKSEVEDKLEGFALGIDDYMPKPFSPKELISRIKVVDRRAKQQQSPQAKNTNILTAGAVALDKDARTILVDGISVVHTPKEFDLLAYLISNTGKALSRDQMLNKVWGYEFYGEDRTVDTHIKMIRSRLGIHKDYIKTIWGHGYKFEVSENE